MGSSPSGIAYVGQPTPPVLETSLYAFLFSTDYRIGIGKSPAPCLINLFLHQQITGTSSPGRSFDKDSFFLQFIDIP